MGGREGRKERVVVAVMAPVMGQFPHTSDYCPTLAIVPRLIITLASTNLPLSLVH